MMSSSFHHRAVRRLIPKSINAVIMNFLWRNALLTEVEGMTFLQILFVLRFYGPVNPMGSCRARSVYLTTRLLGRLSPLSG